MFAEIKYVFHRTVRRNKSIRVTIEIDVILIRTIPDDHIVQRKTDTAELVCVDTVKRNESSTPTVIAGNDHQSTARFQNPVDLCEYFSYIFYKRF